MSGLIRHDGKGRRPRPFSNPTWKVMAAANRLAPHHETLKLPAAVRCARRPPTGENALAKKITGYLKLQVPAGSANPSPPIGPALGQRGLNIMEFCKAFNAQTQNLEKGSAHSTS